jgi:hypothetical protein
MICLRDSELALFEAGMMEAIKKQPLWFPRAAVLFDVLTTLLRFTY